MKATKLSSGNWNVRVQRNGVSKSFTAPTKREAIANASEWLLNGGRTPIDSVSVQTAMRQYIEAKMGVLSLSTLAQYERYVETGFEMIKNTPVNQLTSLDVQTAVSIEAQKKTQRGGKPLSAKYIKNEFSFLSAAVRLVRPEFHLQVTLPKPIKQFRDLPAPEEVIKAVRGTDIELPALLALWLSLSASEIRGIKVSSIKGDLLTIDETIVQVNGEAIHKARGKAYGRNRRLRIPDYIMQLIEQTDAWRNGEGYIETRSGKAISSRFTKVTGCICRFHDLRHLFASVGCALNIPEKYLMEAGGWTTPETMKRVYQHTFETERIKQQAKIDRFYYKILQRTGGGNPVIKGKTTGSSPVTCSKQGDDHNI